MIFHLLNLAINIILKKTCDAWALFYSLGQRNIQKQIKLNVLTIYLEYNIVSEK